MKKEYLKYLISGIDGKILFAIEVCGHKKQVEGWPKYLKYYGGPVYAVDQDGIVYNCKRNDIHENGNLIPMKDRKAKAFTIVEPSCDKKAINFGKEMLEWYKAI